jgi:hypothetical protein
MDAGMQLQTWLQVMHGERDRRVTFTGNTRIARSPLPDSRDSGCTPPGPAGPAGRFWARSGWLLARAWGKMAAGAASSSRRIVRCWRSPVHLTSPLGSLPDRLVCQRHVTGVRCVPRRERDAEWESMWLFARARKAPPDPGDAPAAAQLPSAPPPTPPSAAAAPTPLASTSVATCRCPRARRLVSRRRRSRCRCRAGRRSASSRASLDSSLGRSRPHSSRLDFCRDVSMPPRTPPRQSLPP